MMQSPENDSAKQRILRFLRHGPARLDQASSPGGVLLRNDCGTIAADRAILRSLARTGRLVAKDDQIALAAASVGPEVGADAFGNQHRDMAQITIGNDSGVAEVSVNLSESPLSQLARYRLRDGSAFVTGAEVSAGERLREDYTRGRILPRLGANWEAAVAPGRRAGGGGLADLTDAALGARQRVDKALSAVGPELAGVLVDVCCFLKGLELVERERGWPVRSAKVVLKTALAALARHYHPPSARRQRGPLLHWGSDNYRPELR